MRTPPRPNVAIIAPRDEPGRMQAVHQSKVASARILNIAHSLVDTVCFLWALPGGARRLRFGIVASRLSFGITMISPRQSIMIKSKIMTKTDMKTAGRKDLCELHDL